MNYVQNTNRWEYFGKCSSKDLEYQGTDDLQPEWIQSAYRWFYERLPESQKKTFWKPQNVPAAGPSARYVPFPCAIESRSNKQYSSEDGLIAFVSVDSNGDAAGENLTYNNDIVKQHAYAAARFLYTLFRQFDDRIGFPNIEIQAPDASGSSLSLSAFLAALCQIMQIRLPDTFIATGSWEEKEEKEENEKKQSRFQTVGASALAEKIIAAVRFGYRKFLLVEGQKGTFEDASFSPSELLQKLKEDGTLPPDAPLEFIEVPTAPMEAVFRLLQELPEGNDCRTAALLRTYEKQYLRHDARSGFDSIIKTVSPFCESGSNLVKHVAFDILSRRELHLGNTQNARKYREQTPVLRPSEYPTGFLASYLKYEEAASRAVLELDLGNLDENHPAHALVERILERLKGNIFDDIADIEDVRTALALANTKARRLYFLGRLNADSVAISQAWEELTAFKDYWTEIFEYTKRMNLQDETFERQRNQCVECMADFRHVTGTVLECEKLPQTFELCDTQNAFDLVAWIQWHVMHETLDSGKIQGFRNKADGFYEGEKSWKGFPNFLPYEKILLYRVGTDEDQRHARNQLARAFHLQLGEAPIPCAEADVLSLLAIRSAFLLEDAKLAETFYARIPQESLLKRIADRLFEEPSEAGFRCIY